MKTAKEWADEFRAVAEGRSSAMGATLECVIRDAMAAEREECAKVAEQYDNYTVDGRPSAVGAVIATAIRGEASDPLPHITVFKR